MLRTQHTVIYTIDREYTTACAHYSRPIDIQYSKHLISITTRNITEQITTLVTGQTYRFPRSWIIHIVNVFYS